MNASDYSRPITAKPYFPISGFQFISSVTGAAAPSHTGFGVYWAADSDSKNGGAGDARL